jgi:thiol-disulfide isomerase/thioredoxin
MKIILSCFWLMVVMCLDVVSPWIAFADETPKESRQKIYDESANGERQVSDALVLAKNESKNVFLLFGANSCVPCLKLHAFIESEKTVSEALRSNYILVPIACVKPHNQDLISRYGAANGFGMPFIVILGANGLYLTTKDTTELGSTSDDDQYSPEKVLAFLMEWKPKTKPQLVKQLVDIFLEHDYSMDPLGPRFHSLQEMSDGVVPYLIDVIGTNSSSTNEQQKRINAYSTLGLLHSTAKSAIPFLTEQFNTNNILREFDAAALREFGRKGNQAIPVLTNAFHDADFETQYEAAWALTKVEPDYPELIPKMLAWLGSSNVFCRRTAPIILGDLGPLAARTKSALAEALNDEDKTVRENAAQALKKIEANTAEKDEQSK